MRRATPWTSPSPRSGQPRAAGSGPSAGPVKVNLKMLLRPVAQKFNTFNTFNIFNTFDPDA
jgi:hypothetical protein